MTLGKFIDDVIEHVRKRPPMAIESFLFNAKRGIVTVVYSMGLHMLARSSSVQTLENAIDIFPESEVSSSFRELKQCGQNYYRGDERPEEREVL